MGVAVAAQRSPQAGPRPSFRAGLAAGRAAGWGPGQLDAEIAEGSWHLAPALPSDLFTDRPDLLWRDVLRRQPAPVSMLATLPEDASLN